LLDVRSTDESLEQIELETYVKEQAGDLRLDREQRGRLHRGAIAGLLSGIVLTLLGGWLFIFGIVGGVLVPAPNGYSSIVGLFMLVLGLTHWSLSLDCSPALPTMVFCGTDGSGLLVRKKNSLDPKNPENLVALLLASTRSALKAKLAYYFRPFSPRR